MGLRLIEKRETLKNIDTIILKDIKIVWLYIYIFCDITILKEYKINTFERNFIIINPQMFKIV